MNYQVAPGGGGGYLGQISLGMCRWPLRTPMYTQWPITDPIRSPSTGASFSYILSLRVDPFPSSFIYRTALRGGFARTQFKDPIKAELDRVYCLSSSVFIGSLNCVRAKTLLKTDCE